MAGKAPAMIKALQAVLAARAPKAQTCLIIQKSRGIGDFRSLRPFLVFEKILLAFKFKVFNLLDNNSNFRNINRSY